MLSWTPEIHQYLLEQDHLLKRTTWSRYAIPFTLEPCEIISHGFKTKGLSYSWERPGVLRALGSAYKQSRGPLLSVTLYPGQDHSRKWAWKLWPWRASVGTSLGSLFPAQIQSGKKKREKKGKLHSSLVLKRKSLLRSCTWLDKLWKNNHQSGAAQNLASQTPILVWLYHVLRLHLTTILQILLTNKINVKTYISEIFLNWGMEFKNKTFCISLIINKMQKTLVSVEVIF